MYLFCGTSILMWIFQDFGIPGFHLTLLCRTKPTFPTALLLLGKPRFFFGRKVSESCDLCQSTILARTEEDKGLKYKCYSQRDDGLDGLHSISFHVAPGLWFNRIGNRIEDIMIWPCL